jgi:hypothetical protein
MSIGQAGDHRRTVTRHTRGFEAVPENPPHHADNSRGKGRGGGRSEDQHCINRMKGEAFVQWKIT